VSSILRILLAVAALGACALAVGGCKEKRASVDVTPPASASAAPIASVASIPSVPGAPRDASPPAEQLVYEGDAGVAACKVAGVAEVQPWSGPAVLRIAHHPDADVVEVVVNEAGTPRGIVPAFTYDGGAPPGLAPKSGVPSCAVAGDAVYCPDAQGGIHRGDRVVAHARSGTDIAGAMLGAHVLLAYIGERVTSEGLVREAYVTMDDGPPQRLSEEGSGATFVDLAPRGEQVVAMLIDARVALTPTHARVLSLKNGKLDVGPDAVIFVGGSAERHNAGTLATTKEGAAFALIAVSNDAMRFGMAAIRVDDPPQMDAPVVWSLYPNGLDPAPVAATRGGKAMHVARVRPKTADPKSSRILEYGDLDASGAFVAPCLAAEAAFLKDVELALDRDDAPWIFFRDPRGSRVIRLDRRTPAPPR